MSPVASNARVALVHDWLTTYVGGERVLEQMISLYGAADLFTSIDILPDDQRGFLQGKRAATTFAQRLPFVRDHYRTFLPVLMLAIEQLDLSSYELILSSSAAIARGVLTGPDQLHIAYIHSPMRYAWDLQHQYLRDAGLSGIKGLLARWVLHRARLWDLRTANGVDHFIANSRYIARRIWKVWRRNAVVIYPPVDVDAFALRERKEGFYLAASRLVPYKKMLAIVQAFSRLPNQRLVVIGDGPEMPAIKASATANVEVLGYQPAHVLCDCMQRAKALIFAAEEDFGITVVEAQACGTPVIAFGRGGAVETVRGTEDEDPTGLFFARQEPEAIARAVEAFERSADMIAPRACRENAVRFSVPIFRRRYSAFVQRCWEEFAATPARERVPARPRLASTSA